MLPKKKDRHTLLIKKLDRLIATALPKSQQLSFAKEIAFKLIPAIAIALSTTYLIVCERDFLILSANLSASIAYFISMIALATYIYFNRNQKILRHIQVIPTILGCIWFLTQSGKIQLPTNSFLSLLCMANLFISILAINLLFIDNIYYASRYLDRFPFEKHRYLVISNLTSFDTREINFAIFNLKKIIEKLDRKIHLYLTWSIVFFILLFWGTYIILFCQAALQRAWWFYPPIVGGFILLGLLSITAIFRVIDNINCIKRKERYHLYISILLKYDIERLKFTTSLLKTKLD